MTDAFQANRDARDDDSNSIETSDDADSGDDTDSQEPLPESKQLLVLSEEAAWFEKTTPADVDTSYRDGEGRITIHYDESTFEEIHDTRYGKQS